MTKCELCDCEIGNEGGTQTLDGKWMCRSDYTALASHLMRGVFNFNEAFLKHIYLRDQTKQTQGYMLYLRKIAITKGITTSKFFEMIEGDVRRTSIELMAREWDTCPPTAKNFILSGICATPSRLFGIIDEEAIEKVIISKKSDSYYYEVLNSFYRYY